MNYSKYDIINTIGFKNGNATLKCDNLEIPVKVHTINQTSDGISIEADIIDALNDRVNYCAYSNKSFKSPRTSFDISKVIFNDPATIVLWADGTKTVVKCQEGDIFDEEKGLAMAICKKAYGNKGNFNDIFKEWVVEDTPEVMIDIKTTPLSSVIDNLQQKLYDAFGMSNNIIADKSEPTGWISTKERLPEKNELYIVCTSTGYVTLFYYDPVDPNFVTYWKEDITHWMPMPEKPEVKKK